MDALDRFNKYFNKPENLTSLAGKYEVTTITLRKWLKPINDKIRLSHKHIFTPLEVKSIIEFLGEYNIDVD